jgi:hypothetical protein
MRTPTDRDNDLLLDAQERLARFVEESHKASHWLLETVDAAQAELWLTNLELALPAIGELFANEDIPSEEQREWWLPLSAVLGDYVQQRFGGTWMVDDVPTSHSFGRPIIELHTHGREIHRFDVMARAVDFLALPPPRDLMESVVSPIQGALEKHH